MLASTMVLLLLMVFLTVNLAALVLRREQVDRHRYRAPVVLPVLGLASCLLLATLEGEVGRFGLPFLAAGAVLAWIAAVRRGSSV